MKSFILVCVLKFCGKEVKKEWRRRCRGVDKFPKKKCSLKREIQKERIRYTGMNPLKPPWAFADEKKGPVNHAVSSKALYAVFSFYKQVKLAYYFYTFKKQAYNSIYLFYIKIIRQIIKQVNMI